MYTATTDAQRKLTVAERLDRLTESFEATFDLAQYPNMQYAREVRRSLMAQMQTLAAQAGLPPIEE